MVLLSYQAEAIRRDNKVSEKDSVVKSEGPKTAYIDKLHSFNELYADEERCDLFFICQDGEIPAHRLVISNASKYIMAMQDDQPPWYPVYISVPDLTKEMVNTLVRLAYTGQMNIPPGITSEELLDAMQALGWVNSDCLSATYLDSSGASAEDDFGASVANRTAESLETVLKMNFPVAPKGEADTSDDDDGMEMAVLVPDIPVSDDDEGKLQIDESTKKKVVTAKRTRQRKAAKTPPKTKEATPSRRGQSPKQSAEASKPTESPSSARKGSRKNNEDATPSKDSKPEVAIPNSAEGDSEPLRSRTRTIRKPKKFDDLIVMTPTKRKDTPVKSPSKPTPKNSKPEKETTGTEVVAKTSRKSVVSKNLTNDNNSVRAGSKNQRSASSESKDSSRNSLITSYFNKRSRSPRKSNDGTVEPEGTQDGVSDSTGSTDVQNVEDGTNDVSKKIVTDGLGDTETDTVEDKNTSVTRKRARSTASSKGEKEILRDETDTDNEATGKSRRKRNGQENSEVETAETINPVKRGRKASTVSNASKISNKETAPENDLDDSVTDNPRKRRSRQE